MAEGDLFILSEFGPPELVGVELTEYQYRWLVRYGFLARESADGELKLEGSPERD